MNDRQTGIRCSETEGAPPPVDLAHEKKTGDFVRTLIRSGTATACHDLSDGGLAIALAEMALAGKIGATIAQPENPVTAFFGEDQGRYLMTIRPEALEKLLADAEAQSVSVAQIGTTGGDTLNLGDARPLDLADLSAAHENWFPAYMAG